MIEKIIEHIVHRSALQSELSRSDECLFHYLEMKRFIWQVYADQHPEDKHAKRIISYINMMIQDAYSPNNPTLVDQALAREMDRPGQKLKKIATFHSLCAFYFLYSILF